MAVGRGVVRKSKRGAACVRNEINVKIRSAPLPSAAAKGKAGAGGVYISPARGRPHVPVSRAGFPTTFFFFLLHSMWQLSSLTESKALFHFDGSNDVRALMHFVLPV